MDCAWLTLTVGQIQTGFGFLHLRCLGERSQAGLSPTVAQLPWRGPFERNPLQGLSCSKHADEPRWVYWMSFGQAAVATKLICSGGFFFFCQTVFLLRPHGASCQRTPSDCWSAQPWSGFGRFIRRTVALIRLQPVFEVISEFLSQLVLPYEELRVERYRPVYAECQHGVCRFLQHSIRKNFFCLLVLWDAVSLISDTEFK